MEPSRLEMLRRVTRQMATTENLPSVLQSIVTAMNGIPGILTVRLWLYLQEHQCDVCLAEGSADRSASRPATLHLSASSGLIDEIGRQHHLLPIELDIPPAIVARTGEPMHIPDLLSAAGYKQIAEIAERLRRAGAVGAASYPLIFKGELLGTIGMIGNRALEVEEFELLGIFADQAAMAIKSAQVFREVARYRDQLESENAYLQEELQEERGFEGIIGESSSLRQVLRKVQQVARVETTVLLTGETGTGKELIARALHEGSPRIERPFVKINCGAIPQGVVESEIFGHEKGAFTGALARRIGRFELADSGTLFMDEVGELPLDTQVKLFRVLQEREFERVGAAHSQKVDVRLVAATNRDLEKEVAENRFRSDLYYRLNVFPIRLPPLRERPSDIPLLVRHFLAQFQRKLAKPLREVTRESMYRMEQYDWPGNIRELQNVLERACVLADGPVVEVMDPLVAHTHNGKEAAAQPVAHAPSHIIPLEESERIHIRRALSAAQGKVHGPAGAAAMLGINPSTLRSRMQKLGIATKPLN